MKPKVTWILVADGSRGRIYRREGEKAGLQTALDQEFSHEVRRMSEMGTERPGKVRESGNSAHHAIAPRADWTRQEKQQFAGQLAGVIEEHAQRKEFDRLILVAPPQTLGDLRAALGKLAQERLVGELGKDLTALPVKDLEAHLQAANLILS